AAARLGTTFAPSVVPDHALQGAARAEAAAKAAAAAAATAAAEAAEAAAAAGPGEDLGKAAADGPGEDLGDGPGEDLGDGPGGAAADGPGGAAADGPDGAAADGPGGAAADGPGEDVGDGPGEDLGDGPGGAAADGPGEDPPFVALFREMEDAEDCEALDTICEEALANYAEDLSLHLDDPNALYLNCPVCYAPVTIDHPSKGLVRDDQVRSLSCGSFGGPDVIKTIVRKEPAKLIKARYISVPINALRNCLHRLEDPHVEELERMVRALINRGTLAVHFPGTTINDVTLAYPTLRNINMVRKICYTLELYTFVIVIFSVVIVHNCVLLYVVLYLLDLFVFVFIHNQRKHFHNLSLRTLYFLIG
ncbi:putative GPI-anchored adhesin-like protein PGA18, partial [Frankliniella fusca]